MFRRGQKISRHISRIRAFVREHEYLARPSDRIDTDMAVYTLFGKRHENISRAAYFCHFRNGFRPVGKRGDRLCAAHLIYFRRPGQMCRHKSYRRHFSVCLRRRCHNDPLHAGHLCRNDVHQDAGRIGRLSAWYIHAGTCERRHALPKDDAVVPRIDPAFLHLFLMKIPYICERLFHYVDQPVIHERISLVDLILRHPDGFLRNVSSVKLFCVSK